MIQSQKGEIYRAHQGDEQLRRDQQLHEQSLKQNWDLREAHEKSFSEMEELKRFLKAQHSTQLRESNQNPIIKYGKTRLWTRIHKTLRVDT